MAGRIVAETLLAAFATVALLLIGAGMLELGDADSAADAFFRSGPANVFGVFGLAVGIWVLLLVAANVLARHRRATTRFLANALLTVVVAGFTVAFWGVAAMSAGGFAALVLAIAIVDAMLFVVAGLLALALTHLLVFRRPVRAGAY